MERYQYNKPFIDPNLPLSSARSCARTQSSLSRTLNQVSTGVINSMSLSITFPVIRRVERTFHENNDEAEINGINLEEWGASVSIGIGPRVFSVDRKRILRLCYHYRHLNGNDLSDFPFTDLITHRIRLKPGTRPYNKRH
jgi:hypothetical protein